MTQMAALRDGHEQSPVVSRSDTLLFSCHARIVIIGLGLLGMSLLRATRSFWPNIAVDAYDLDPGTRDYVRGAGLGVTIHDGPHSIPAADLFIICTPASSVLSVVAFILAVATPGSIIMDVASVKSGIMAQIGPLLPSGVHYVSAHPMAGGSTGGAEFGRGDLFQGKPCTLTPLDATPAQTLQAVEHFWTMIGSRPGVVASPALHDNRVALTSHLPHLVAFALMDTLDRQSLSAKDHLFVGRSLRDFMRLGAANPTIWCDILYMNRKHILAHVDAFHVALQMWREILASASEEEVSTALHHSVVVAKCHEVTHREGADE